MYHLATDFVVAKHSPYSEVDKTDRKWKIMMKPVGRPKIWIEHKWLRTGS